MITSTYQEDFKITDSEKLQMFISGGKGVIILVAPSGKSHTYQFCKPQNKLNFPEDVIFVYCIHEDTRFYLGTIERGKFRLTRNSRFENDTEVVKGAYYIVKMSKNPELLKNSKMRVYHNGRCAKCGRELSSEKAVEFGIGPKCLKRVKNVMNYVEK